MDRLFVVLLICAVFYSKMVFSFEFEDKEEIERNIGRLHRELVFDTRENAVRSKQYQWDLFNPFYGHKCSRDLRMTATINDFKQDIRDSYNRCGILFIISANEWKKFHGEEFEDLIRELHTCRGKHLARIQNRIDDLYEDVHACKRTGERSLSLIQSI